MQTLTCSRDTRPYESTRDRGIRRRMHSSPVGIRQEQYADRPGYDAPSTPLSAKTLLLFCRSGTEEGSRGPLLFLSERGGFEPSAFLYVSMAQRGAASRSSLPLGRNPHPSALMAYRLRGRRPHDSNRQQRHCDLPVASGHRACLDHILPHLPVPSTMSGTTPKRHHSTASSRRTTRSFSPGSKPKAAC